MQKRKICMVTNWYPSKQNPFVGSFFKEQAFALSESFDFIVLHYHDCSRLFSPGYWFRSLCRKYAWLHRHGVEKNTTEYTLYYQLPWYALLANKLSALRHKGESALYRKKKQQLIEHALRNLLCDTFDLVYCVCAQTESDFAQYVAQAANVPYVLSEHGPFPWLGTLLKPGVKEVIEQADTFLAISYDKIRQVMLQNIQPKRIAYVGNMVNEEQFVLGNGSGCEKTFVTVGSHTFYKNYPLFIKIFDRLTQITDVPFKVMVVGYNANQGYSKNAEELEQKLRTSLFADKVELIPAISRDLIHTVYGRADAFVMTSVQEGMPVSALEAGCCGLPIFSTMCGGVEDYVDDTMGRIYRIVDSESFAQGLKAYLEGDITFDREHIRHRVVSQFGYKAFSENMASIFRDVIRRHEAAE